MGFHSTLTSPIGVGARLTARLINTVLNAFENGLDNLYKRTQATGAVSLAYGNYIVSCPANTDYSITPFAYLSNEGIPHLDIVRADSFTNVSGTGKRIFLTSVAACMGQTLVRSGASDIALSSNIFFELRSIGDRVRLYHSGDAGIGHVIETFSKPLLVTNATVTGSWHLQAGDDLIVSATTPTLITLLMPRLQFKGASMTVRLGATPAFIYFGEVGDTFTIRSQPGAPTIAGPWTSASGTQPFAQGDRITIICSGTARTFDVFVERA